MEYQIPIRDEDLFYHLSDEMSGSVSDAIIDAWKSKTEELGRQQAIDDMAFMLTYDAVSPYLIASALEIRETELADLRKRIMTEGPILHQLFPVSKSILITEKGAQCFRSGYQARIRETTKILTSSGFRLVRITRGLKRAWAVIEDFWDGVETEGLDHAKMRQLYGHNRYTTKGERL